MSNLNNDFSSVACKKINFKSGVLKCYIPYFTRNSIASINSEIFKAVIT